MSTRTLLWNSDDKYVAIETALYSFVKSILITVRNGGGSWGSLIVLPGYTTKLSKPPTLMVYGVGQYNGVLLYIPNLLIYYLMKKLSC